jgi:hypothetical protein
MARLQTKRVEGMAPVSAPVPAFELPRPMNH